MGHGKPLGMQGCFDADRARNLEAIPKPMSPQAHLSPSPLTSTSFIDTFLGLRLSPVFLLVTTTAARLMADLRLAATSIVRRSMNRREAAGDDDAIDPRGEGGLAVTKGVGGRRGPRSAAGNAAGGEEKTDDDDIFHTPRGIPSFDPCGKEDGGQQRHPWSPSSLVSSAVSPVSAAAASSSHAVGAPGSLHSRLSTSGARLSVSGAEASLAHSGAFPRLSLTGVRLSLSGSGMHSGRIVPHAVGVGAEGDAKGRGGGRPVAEAGEGGPEPDDCLGEGREGETRSRGLRAWPTKKKLEPLPHSSLFAHSSAEGPPSPHGHDLALADRLEVISADEGSDGDAGGAPRPRRMAGGGGSPSTSLPMLCRPPLPSTGSLPSSPLHDGSLPLAHLGAFRPIGKEGSAAVGIEPSSSPTLDIGSFRAASGTSHRGGAVGDSRFRLAASHSAPFNAGSRFRSRSGSGSGSPVQLEPRCVASPACLALNEEVDMEGTLSPVVTGSRIIPGSRSGSGAGPHDLNTDRHGQGSRTEGAEGISEKVTMNMASSGFGSDAYVSLRGQAGPRQARAGDIVRPVASATGVGEEEEVAGQHQHKHKPERASPLEGESLSERQRNDHLVRLQLEERLGPLFEENRTASIWTTTFFVAVILSKVGEGEWTMRYVCVRSDWSSNHLLCPSLISFDSAYHTGYLNYLPLLSVIPSGCLWCFGRGATRGRCAAGIKGSDCHQLTSLTHQGHLRDVPHLDPSSGVCRAEGNMQRHHG